MKSLLLPTDPTSLQALVLGVRGPSIPVPSFLQSALGTTSIPGVGFFLDAYSVANDADILSTPHILATDNMPAELHVQLNTSLQRNAASYGSPSLSGTAGGTAASALSLYSAPASQNYGKIGPQIKVTPHIDDSEDVRLDVTETISDLTGEPPQGTLGTINFTERGASTTLTVKDGHTAVIGGLVKDKVTHYAVKVPLLGDIPILGALFRSTNLMHDLSRKTTSCSSSRRTSSGTRTTCGVLSRSACKSGRSSSTTTSSSATALRSGSTRPMAMACSPSCGATTPRWPSAGASRRNLPTPCSLTLPTSRSIFRQPLLRLSRRLLALPRLSSRRRSLRRST